METAAHCVDFVRLERDESVQRQAAKPEKPPPPDAAATAAAYAATG